MSELRGTISTSGNLGGSLGSSKGSLSGGMGVARDDHRKLSNRDAPDQHPIAAITKLKDTLDTKPDETLGNEDIQNIIDGYYDPSGGDTSGDEPQIVVDPSLSSSSPNPVQNKAIYAALAKKEDTGTAAELINGHDASPNAHEDIRKSLAEKLTQADLQSGIDEALAEIDLSVYAEKTELEDYLPLTGGTCTGGITAPNFQTGSDNAAFFQTKKMRGQGDANEYRHAVDWGYSGHDMVDFYEYGGTWKFWQCQSQAKSGARLIGSITPTGWNGSAALTGTPTAPTAAEGTNTTQIATTAFVNTAIKNSRGKYELIETITMEEDGNLIERTAEPDGTAYNFATIAIKADFPTSKSGSKVTNFLIDAYIDKSTPSLLVESFTTYSLNKYSNKATVLVENHHGMFFVQMSDVTSNRGYVGYPTKIPSSYEIGEAIWKLKIATTSDNSLYAGTVIKIYGVREAS